jgi:hypothetical protein
VTVRVKDQFSFNLFDRFFDIIIFIDINSMLSLSTGHQQAGVI